LITKLLRPTNHSDDVAAICNRLELIANADADDGSSFTKKAETARQTVRQMLQELGQLRND
jgi:hypothetical protein